jgi:threonine/homoserine/homoserine lactone efflux protein
MAVGFLGSAPMGPIAVLAIQKTIHNGYKSGLSLGMGSALGDLFYAIIAGFGLTIISNFIIQYTLIIRIIGSAVLLYLGFKIFYSNPAKQIRKQQIKTSNPINNILTSFFLTLSNPITIFGFCSLFAASGIVHENTNTFIISLVVSGVFIGAICWWLLLIGFINYFKHKIRLRSMWWINKITGSIVVLCGIIIIASLFFR